MRSDDPNQYDPVKTLTRAIRFLKTFSRRFLLPLIIFGFSLNEVVSNSPLSIVSVIILNACITWFIVIFYRDRTLRYSIHLQDRIDLLNEGLANLRTEVLEAKNKELKNPLLNNKQNT